MPRFEIGEIAIYVSVCTHKVPDNTDVEILSVPKIHDFGFESVLAYRVSAAGFQEDWCPEKCLHKRKPPREETTKWSEIKDQFGNEIFNPMVEA